MWELKNKLIKFREITLNIITSLENEDYDSPEALLEERENIIREISKLNYHRDDFRKVSQELNLILVEKKLHKLITEKRLKLKLQLKESSEMKTANQNYTTKQHNKDNILDIKI